MKKEDILRWLASNWRKWESEANRSQPIFVADDEADIRQVNAEVLSCLGYQTSRPLPEDPFRHYPRREKVAVAGHQAHGKRSARSGRATRSEPGLSQDSIAKQPCVLKKR